MSNSDGLDQLRVQVSVGEAAEFLGTSERTLYRVLARQHLPPRRGKVEMLAAIRAFVRDAEEEAAPDRVRKMTDDPLEQRVLAAALIRH